MTEEARRPLSEIWPSPNPVHLDGVVDGRGNLYLAANTTSSRIIKVDGDSLQLLADVASGADQITLEMLTLYDLTGRIDLLLSIGFLGVDTRVFRTEDLSLFWTGPNVAQRPRGVLAGKIAFGRCEAWVIASPSTTLGAATASVQIRRIVIEPPLFKDPISGDTPGLSYTDVTLTAAELGLATIVAFAPCYDEVNDRIVFIVTDGVGGPKHLVSYSAAGVVWQTPIGANENLPVRGRFPFEQIWLYGGEQVRMRSTDDGSLLFSQSGFPASVGELRFDPQTSVFYSNSGSNLRQIVAGRGSDSSVALADVVTALCGSRRPCRRGPGCLRADRRGAGLRHRPPGQRARRHGAAGRHLCLRRRRERPQAQVQEARQIGQPGPDRGRPGASVRARNVSARQGRRRWTCRCASRCATRTPTATPTKARRPPSVLPARTPPWPRTTRRPWTCRSR